MNFNYLSGQNVLTILYFKNSLLKHRDFPPVIPKGSFLLQQIIQETCITSF